MEAIITVVGFLGAGKTTLLKHLTTNYLDNGWNPFVILNDYENAYLDSQQFIEQLDAKYVRSLHGSCICCSGIEELRGFVNSIPERENGITLIEANGTSDACSLMGFLGVGINERFLPPIQISVVDVKNWQRRGVYKQLESNQVQVSSLVVLTHLDKVTSARKNQVIGDIKRFNSSTEIIDMDEIDVHLLPKIAPSTNNAEQLDHQKAHWASSSVDIPQLPDHDAIRSICDQLPRTILRVKGCTQIGSEEPFTYFERTPDGEVYIRPYNGIPITGPKLVCIGPGSQPLLLEEAIAMSLLKK
ncbi:cobalamin biosynthesis protein CobW [Flavobacteriales bacterium]|nr:cobalamin biosynthesis protein CobW [Flavobacteriales bacterium]